MSKTAKPTRGKPTNLYMRETDIAIVVRAVIHAATLSAAFLRAYRQGLKQACALVASDHSLGSKGLAD
jgi:hypothetical protein